MTPQQVRDVLHMVLASYPTQRQRMTDADAKAMFAAWCSALADIDADDCKRGVQRVLLTSKWLPTIAEVREAVGLATRGDAGAPERCGADAWGDIRALRSYRDREAMQTVDPITMHVLQAFDWIEWRTLLRRAGDVEQWHVRCEGTDADRARFIELYDKTRAADRQSGQLRAGARIPDRVIAPASVQLGAGVHALGDVIGSLLPQGEQTK